MAILQVGGVRRMRKRVVRLGTVSLARYERVRREIVAACYAGLDSHMLRRRVLALCSDAVSVDGGFFAATDPATMLHTSTVSLGMPVESTPQFLHNEFSGSCAA